jgi:hypothetical protein
MRLRIANHGRATGSQLKLAVTVAAAALAAIAGCTSGNGGTATNTGTSPGAAPGAASAGTDHAGVWREFVDCARRNGQTNWPDPVVDPATGRATFPAADGFEEKTAYEAVRAACASVLDRLPPQANPLALQQVSPEQMEVRRRYAQCMRRSGMPDFPDPGPDGTFAEPTTGDRQAARAACDGMLLASPGQ